MLPRLLSQTPRLLQQVSASLRPISQSACRPAQVTVAVPSMGDSITEGTIVEWVVPVGARVAEGDVLALIETDKVTVDIKADREGVLVQQLGEPNGVVEVGQGLYVLDTDVSLSSTEAPSDAGRSDSETQFGRETLTRVPSIHFLGKEGWKTRRDSVHSLSSSTVASNSPQQVAPNWNAGKPHSPSSVTYVPYSYMYGRPSISQDEMDALVLGGADEAPEVKSVVSKDGLKAVIFTGGKVVTAGPRGVWLAKENL